MWGGISNHGQFESLLTTLIFLSFPVLGILILTSIFLFKKYRTFYAKAFLWTGSIFFGSILLNKIFFPETAQVTGLLIGLVVFIASLVIYFKNKNNSKTTPQL